MLGSSKMASYVRVVQGIIVYDRQTLLNIRASLVDLTTLYAEDGNAHHCLFPRLPEGVWAPRCGSHRKKRLRRRGKRAGALVKLRDLARSCSISPSSLPLHLFDNGSDQRSCYFHRRSMEPRYASLRPVWPVQDELPQAPLNIPARLRVKRGGAVLHNLRLTPTPALFVLTCCSVPLYVCWLFIFCLFKL
ncbi:hypothetical protein AAFF_G00275020 [Aldrovandia affinis]|uniref:Uncharacterized protein n=1 Tax=Aldrovandia affinis TaxID=143900 RepID=A0AAD7SRU9_9TELE|nr:hypothetical protein AAFF_G00275020 [Aldrovandia affinis]